MTNFLTTIDINEKTLNFDRAAQTTPVPLKERPDCASNKKVMNKRIL